MTARDRMLANIKAAVADAAPEELADYQSACSKPAPLETFSEALAALGGQVFGVDNVEAACRKIGEIVAGRSFTVSPAVPGFTADVSRESCASAEFGISSADFALADTGSLVFLSESKESRLISLLPPRHIAVISRDRILSGLDELFDRLPHPATSSSSMVIVTGPSRTADIEMRLVRGVHGPGDVTVIIVNNM